MKSLGALITGLFALVCVTTAAANERPNILFCIADDASWPHMGAYGCQWVETPAFDRIAREGLLFNNAYTPNAKCAPSRACILTGRNSWQLEAACNHFPIFPQHFKVYTEALRDAGYHVGRTGKGWAPGIANDAEGNPRNLAGPQFARIKQKPPTPAISNNDYAANFADFLEQGPKNQPWCFWYGSTEPHRRYEYGSGVKQGGKTLEQIDKVFDFWPDNDTVRNDLLDYAFEIEHFDDHLGRMIKLLEDSGRLDNTLVVVTSDNGMPFPRVKGQEYELSNHLPLAIMWPQGIEKPGRVIDDYVSFIDFAPTFLDAAGIDAVKSGMQTITGRSLFDIFRSQRSGIVNAERDHVLIGKERHDVGRPNDWGYPIRGIVKNGMLYLQNYKTDRWPQGDPETGYLNCDGSPTKTVILEQRYAPAAGVFWKLAFGKRGAEEFYNVRNDPECMINLAGQPEFASVMQQLKSQMVSELTAQQDPRVLGEGDVFDAYPYSDAKTANFYERYMRGEKLRAGWVNPTDFQEARQLDE